MNRTETAAGSFESPALSSWPRFWWANLLCVLGTIITTTVFGAALVSSFRAGQSLDASVIWSSYIRLAHGDPAILSGLQFSVPLLLILLAHEFGHYIECRVWRVEATLPYFLPSPTLFGTLGAFIRIKSPIYSRRGLFDIGIAGPLAGFAMLIPFLVAGVRMSRSFTAAVPPGPFLFGTPLAFRLVESVCFPAVHSSHILLHPMAMAAWAGLLATAINLLPVGQLDGGHIIYAVLGQQMHRTVSTTFVGVLAALGFWYWTWWVWAVLLFFVGRRHPLVYDSAPLSGGRWLSLVLVCLCFLLSFSVVPVRTS
jgi:hypothetical protein